MTRLRSAGNRSLRALRVRNFRNYFLGQAVSTVGTGMQILAQIWLVLDITESASQLGLVITLQTLPMLVFGPWAGAIADRVDNRRVIVVVAVAAGLLAVALGLLVDSGHVTLHWIWVLALLLGVVQAFERPAGQALLYELVGPDDLASAIGLNGTLSATTRLLGPAAAGLVIANFGIAACFYANAVSFGGVIVAIAFLRTAEMFPRRATTGQVRIRDGFTYAWRTPALRRGLLAMAIVGTLAYNFAQSVSSMVRFVFHSGPGALGLVQTVSAVGSILGGLAVGALARPTCRWVGIAAIAFGLCIAAACVAPTLPVFAIIWLPAGAGSGLYLAATQSLLQRGAAPEYQGRVMALFSIAWIGTTPVGAPLMGWVIDHWSARFGMGVGAASALIAGAYLILGRTPNQAVAPA
jgi:MFS family permease